VLKEHAVDILTSQGHAVQVSDLYKMDFQAVVSPADFSDRADPSLFDLHTEQAYASRFGTFSPDILAEQQKLIWCNMLILQFPLWWYSAPAIMKGWIDRVLAYGFAYGEGHTLAGRRAMLVLTTGGQARPYTPEKRAAMTRLLDPLLFGTLHVCGMDVLPPFVVYGAGMATKDQRNRFLDDYAHVLERLEERIPLNFNH
jgi:NAD(P)H dehydrogenase (quinone)